MAMTLERILEIRGFGQGTSEEITLLPIDVIQPFFEDFAFMLKRFEGSVNYNRVKLSDFNFQPYISLAWGPKGALREVYCAIEHKVKTQNTLNSLVRLWPGPRNDYWVICAELSGLG